MIGVFDSGIGGLTVVRALRDRMPGEDIIYLGDTARTPYGSKSKDTIIQYGLNNTDFLVRRGAKIIVIACNSASSYAYEAVRSRYRLPVFEVIGPGAQLAVQRSKRCRIGVIGTRATISSGIYERKIRDIHADATVVMTPCPLLVPLVEEGWLNKPETAMIVRKYLAPLKIRKVDTLILGCTHYPVLRKLIQRKIGTSVSLVDSAEAIADQVHRHIHRQISEASANSFKKGSCRIFVSDSADQFKKTAHLIMGERVPIELADIQT